tara:strand:- start:973 stop:1146 length:174 start_codon:yes stop_codon:yes gene_type:complete
MGIGNIVEAMHARDLKIRLGIIIKKLPPLELGLEVFEVLTNDGKIDTYTSAALRVLV